MEKVIDMSYWKWWIKRKPFAKLFGVYWFICIVLSFLYMVTHSVYIYGSEVFTFTLLIAVHPGIGMMLLFMLVTVNNFYKEYRNPNV